MGVFDKGYDKRNIVIIILTVLLIISLSYIGYTEYIKFIQENLRKATAEGYRQGVFDTIVKLYKETDTCRPTRIMLGNKTKYVIDIECLQPLSANMPSTNITNRNITNRPST